MDNQRKNEKEKSEKTVEGERKKENKIENKFLCKETRMNKIYK